MATTTPDSIYYPTATDQIAPLETVFATMASSMQSALSGTRAVYTYRWANATARAAQAGMRVGDRGIQVDTGVEYQYLNGAWRAFGMQTGTFSKAGSLTLVDAIVQKDGNNIVSGSLQFTGGLAGGTFNIAVGSFPAGFYPIAPVQFGGFATGNAVPSAIGFSIATNGQMVAHNPGGAHSAFGGSFMFKAATS